MLVSDARVAFQTVDGADARRAVGLRAVPDGTGAEALYLQLAARKPPREQFASSADRRSYFVWQLQRGIVAAGAAVFAACALYGGSRWVEAVNARERAELQTREARAATQQYERITATFPVTQTTTENLRVTVVEFRRIAERSAAPELGASRTRRGCSTAFRRWRSRRSAGVWASPRDARGAKPAAADAKPAAQGETQRAVRALRAASTRRSATTTAASPPRCSASPRRWRAAGYELERTQLPFDITSEGTLTGDIGAAESERGAALHHHADAEAAVTFTPEELRKLALPALLRRGCCSPPAPA